MSTILSRISSLSIFLKKLSPKASAKRFALKVNVNLVDDFYGPPAMHAYYPLGSKLSS